GLTAKDASARMLQRLQRRMGIQIVREYRTIFEEAALTLAECIPFDLQAKMGAQMFQGKRDARRWDQEAWDARDRETAGPTACPPGVEDGADRERS
ncbi:unnamed protein product, partial [Heterotrigona itama]